MLLFVCVLYTCRIYVCLHIYIFLLFYVMHACLPLFTNNNCYYYYCYFLSYYIPTYLLLACLCLRTTTTTTTTTFFPTYLPTYLLASCLPLFTNNNNNYYYYYYNFLSYLPHTYLPTGFLLAFVYEQQLLLLLLSFLPTYLPTYLLASCLPLFTNNNNYYYYYNYFLSYLQYIGMKLYFSVSPAQRAIHGAVHDVRGQSRLGVVLYMGHGSIQHSCMYVYVIHHTWEYKHE